MNDKTPPTQPSDDDNALIADGFSALKGDVDALYIRDNISGRLNFFEKHPAAAAYLFDPALVKFDHEGCSDVARREHLEEEAETRRLSFYEMLAGLENNSVDKGTLQHEYVEGVVRELGRDLALLIYVPKIVDRLIPPPAPPPEAAQENDDEGISDGEHVMQETHIIAPPKAPEPPKVIEAIENVPSVEPISVPASEPISSPVAPPVSASIPQSEISPISAPVSQSIEMASPVPQASPIEPSVEPAPPSLPPPISSPVIEPAPMMEEPSVRPIEVPPPPSMPAPASAQPVAAAPSPDPIAEDVKPIDPSANPLASSPSAPVQVDVPPETVVHQQAEQSQPRESQRKEKMVAGSIQFMSVKTPGVLSKGALPEGDVSVKAQPKTIVLTEADRVKD